MTAASITVVGNVGKEAVLRYTQAGKAVTSFSVAVYAGKDFPPQWFSVVAWEALAEVARELCAKGRKVEVAGYLSSRRWKDKNGEEKVSVEIVAQRIEKVDVKPAAPKPVDDFNYGPPPMSDADLPF